MARAISQNCTSKTLFTRSESDAETERREKIYQHNLTLFLVLFFSSKFYWNHHIIQLSSSQIKIIEQFRERERGERERETGLHPFFSLSQAQLNCFPFLSKISRHEPESQCLQRAQCQAQKGNCFIPQNLIIFLTAFLILLLFPRSSMEI